MHIFWLTLLTVAAIATPLAARAEMGASVSAPFRHDIDGYCDAKRAGVQTQEFLNVSMEGRPYSGWQRASLKRIAALSRDPKFMSGYFATAYVAHKAVVRAEITQTDQTGDGSTSYDYCYRNDRVARIRSTLDSATYDTEWVFTRYYSDGQYLTKSFRSRPLATRRASAPPTPPDSTPLYLRPSALPFYKLIKR